MVCEPNDTDLHIHIPAIMLPQEAGASLESMLNKSSSGKLSLLLKDDAGQNIFPKIKYIIS